MSCVITGVKPGSLSDPAVALNASQDWLVLQTTDGRVVRVHPNQINGGGGGGSLTPFQHIAMGFSGTEITLPSGVNGGKFSTQVNRVKVFLNGLKHYRTVDYTVQINGVGVQDKILFTNPTSGDVLIEFEA